LKLDLDILAMSRELAAHSAVRQELVARNVANADTPGYRAVDLVNFSDVFNSNTTDFAPKISRPTHLRPSGGVAEFRPIESPSTNADKPNGNNVGLEEQMIKGIAVQQDHDLALGIYRKSLGILRLALGRGR
jgi:flagellar basal-body rod protein FlgB